MSVQSLGSRAIIGRFYARLEQNIGMEWIDGTSMLFTSDQASEEYRWLGQSPAMREWIGGRQAKGFTDNGLTIANKHYEATLKVPVADLRRDKTGQVLVRIDELADRANAHWASLLSALILAGESTVGYDGQYFFDTDHVEDASGTQSNDIAVDISALAVTNHGSTTAPSVGEIQQVILQATQSILGFKDNQGEPMNENAASFLVMVPVPLLSAAEAAVTLPFIDRGESNQIVGAANRRYAVRSNARLTWTDKIAVFRTDGSVKPFIRQEETPLDLDVIAEGSEHEAKEKEHIYGVDTWRNVGYGYWQHACLATMT